MPMAPQYSLLNSGKILQFIGLGPSIRARARLALAAAFLVTIPMLFIAVMRTDHVSQHAQTMMKEEDYRKVILEARIALKELDLALWAYWSEIDFDNGQGVYLASDALKHSIVNLVKEKPLKIDIGPDGFLEGLTARLESTIRRAIAGRGTLAPARLTILTFENELKIIEKRLEEIAAIERHAALGSLSQIGRDLLVLLLVLLFFIPIFVGLVPIWLLEPLRRLRQIASNVELGSLKDMTVGGQDEIAVLARTLKSVFLQKDELEHKKSSKIFEIRNVLRSVLMRVYEPVFIIDDNARINYTNEAAAILFGLPAHQMEGKIISDCVHAPQLKKATERAFLGDVSDEAILIHMEVVNGKSHDLNAKIALVRNRDGEVSRVVIVLYADELQPKKTIKAELAYEKDPINTW